MVFKEQIRMIVKAADNRSAFIKGYLECGFFTEGGPDHEEFDGKGFYDFNQEALETMIADCDKFMEDNKFAIANGIYTGTDLSYEHAGHDFWLTRNGHGCGFWDGDWPEDEGEDLTEASGEFGVVDMYVGDDGKVYV